MRWVTGLVKGNTEMRRRELEIPSFLKYGISWG